MNNRNDWLTTKEIYERYGIDRRRVRDLITSGVLVAEKVKRSGPGATSHYVVSVESVEAYLQKKNDPPSVESEHEPKRGGAISETEKSEEVPSALESYFVASLPNTGVAERQLVHDMLEAHDALLGVLESHTQYARQMNQMFRRYLQTAS